MRIFREVEVARLVRQDPGRYIPYIGSGVSAEAEIPTADRICEDIRARLVEGLSPEEEDHFVSDRLEWSKPEARYSRCIHEYGSEAHRVQYFRRLLEGRRPSFAHYAIALLASERVLQRTIITTNFDKLVESAFVHLGGLECQPIRTELEQRYLGYESDKCYVLKLHGDYDTYNIRNTPGELLYIDEGLEKRTVSLTEGGGILVLGSSGFEQSIQRLFGSLVRAMGEDERIASFGLLWGVYMGPVRPRSAPTEEEVREQVLKTVSRNMIQTVDQAQKRNETCGFFPVWGAGEFLYQLLERASSESVRSRANLYLSHRMRLRRVLRHAGVTDEGVKRHQESLDRAKKRLPQSGQPRESEHVWSLIQEGTNLHVDLVYGDISDPALLASEDRAAAVISPEDTTISAGGGVALALLEGAGSHYLLNELAKHQPVEQDDVVLTSAGELPVQYLLHAAALKIGSDGSHLVSTQNVEAVVRNAMALVVALGLRVLWIPLIATGGAGGVTPVDSLSAIARALIGYTDTEAIVKVVIYQEKQLDRSTARAAMSEHLGKGVEE